MNQPFYWRPEWPVYRSVPQHIHLELKCKWLTQFLEKIRHRVELYQMIAHRDLIKLIYIHKRVQYYLLTLLIK